jgi:four helix bundle protein
MSDIQSFKDLIVWQRAMGLAESSYGLTKSFPKDEVFGMTSQIRRAAVSVAANVAEGHGREQTGSFVQFLRIAQGSLKELETHLLLAQRLSLSESSAFPPLLSECDEIGRMLRALIRNLQTKPEN